MVKISIITPTYNRPDYLQRAIASCVTQQGVDSSFEIIVVDNNPEGSARAQVEDIAARGPVPIRYVHEKRPGISHARNTGIAASSARYVVFLDDDEEADPGWLAAHLETMRRFGADIVVGAVHASFPPAPRSAPYPPTKFRPAPAVPTDPQFPRRPGSATPMLAPGPAFP